MKVPDSNQPSTSGAFCRSIQNAQESRVAGGAGVVDQRLRLALALCVGGSTCVHHVERDGDQLGSVASSVSSMGIGRRHGERIIRSRICDSSSRRPAISRAPASTAVSRWPAPAAASHWPGRRCCCCTRRTRSKAALLFPVYQRNRPLHPDERFRFGLNVTYFFWPSKGKGR